MRIPWEVEAVVHALGAFTATTEIRGNSDHLIMPLADNAKFVMQRTAGELWDGALVQPDGTQVVYPDPIDQHSGLAVANFVYVHTQRPHRTSR